MSDGIIITIIICSTILLLSILNKIGGNRKW